MESALVPRAHQGLPLPVGAAWHPPMPAAQHVQIQDAMFGPGKRMGAFVADSVKTALKQVVVLLCFPV